MKKALVILSSLLVAVGAFAQGQVNFANRVVGSYDAPVFVNSLTGARADSTYMAQLYAGPTATSLAAIGAPVPFRTGAAAGYVTSSTAIIPTVAPGSVAQVQIRAWASAAGATYESALAANGATGQSAILAITTGGAGSPPSLPANLDGLTSFAITGIVPEPSVLALGALGGLALLIRRRK
jgi:hypothetical protein